MHMLVLVHQLCKSLADEHDTIRCEYWRYMSRSLTVRYGESLASSGDSVDHTTT